MDKTVYASTRHYTTFDAARIALAALYHPQSYKTFAMTPRESREVARAATIPRGPFCCPQNCSSPYGLHALHPADDIHVGVATRG